MLPGAGLSGALCRIQQIADAGHRRVGGAEVGLIGRDVRLILQVLRDLLLQFEAVFGGRRIVARQHQALTRADLGLQPGQVDLVGVELVDQTLVHQRVADAQSTEWE